MFCKNCGAQLNEGQSICLNCGVKVGDGNNFCGNCGVNVNPAQDVCTNCGVSLKTNGNYLNGQDKVVMALVCFFLGCLGIHNFILGETKKGVLKIILTVLACTAFVSAIIALIDFIKILSDSYVVDPEKFI